MDMHLLRIAICVGFFTIGSLCAAEAGSGKIPEAGERPRNQPITVKATEAGEERVWAMGSSRRSRHLYPSNYGQAGIFRVRSAESLPPYSVTFGIGGEFYAISNAPMFAGSTRARTIAESLFVGFSPMEHLTLGITRRSSSTTFGQPQTLISSLGDFNFAAAYAFPLGEAMVLSPMVNLQVASNFNSLAPAGSTVSAGLGAAFTYSLYPTVGLPIFLHANLLYHGPQIRTNKGPTLEEETFFNFSRFHTVTFAFGAEYILGDFIPFLEFHQSTQAGSGLGWADSPSRFTVGTRITPLSNKSLALLVGTDIGLGQGLVAGVPFNPDYQIVAQASYTVALTQTERKHYFTSQDVNVVDRKFVIRKKIRFKVNSAELEPSSAGLLDQIAEVIRRNNVEKLLIVGHTDSTASEDYNLKLSLARAGSVKSYLVSQGIEADKLLTQGYGKRQPVASNLTEEGRARNRRVEFFILEQSS